ncbi:MAG: tetratricopeptide repeat protein, partial [Desulfarculus sp.]
KIYTPPKPRGPSPQELERIRGMRLNEANELGYAAYMKGDYGRAILYFQRALEYDPHNPNLLHNLKRARERQAQLQANLEAARRKRLADERARLEALRKGEEALRKREAQVRAAEAEARRKAKTLADKLASQRREHKKALAAAAKTKALQEAAAAKAAGQKAAAGANQRQVKGQGGKVFDTPGLKAPLPTFTPSSSPPVQVTEPDPVLGRRVVVPERFKGDRRIKTMQKERQALEGQHQELDQELAVIRKSKEQYPDLKPNLEVLEAKLKQKQSDVKNKIIHNETMLNTYIIDLSKEGQAAKKEGK